MTVAKGLIPILDANVIGNGVRQVVQHKFMESGERIAVIHGNNTIAGMSLKVVEIDKHLVLLGLVGFVGLHSNLYLHPSKRTESSIFLSKPLGLKPFQHFQRRMTTSFPTLSTGSGLMSQAIVPASVPLLAATDKPRVFLTTVKISDEHIWANGLFQNIYILYKMMETLGYEPILMVDNLDNNKDATIIKRFRITDFKQYISAPFRVAAYLEMGMSCDPSIRKFFRNMGAKVAKLYMGNILNIDIETITFYPGTTFSHHVAGEIDEIWVSPHYDIHAEYAGAINGLYGKTRIAPYVWDPMFIEENGSRYDATGITEATPRIFIVMEPNISFQKNSLMPIMALEAYYRKFPSRIDHVIVVNGQRFKENAYFTNSIAPQLTILKSGKLQLMPRAHVGNLMKVMKHAIVLQHQVNNEYNYSLLEFMKMGFPLIHNVPRLATYGYYYPGNDFDAAAKQIERVVSSHNDAVYKTQAEQLEWQFSIHNPVNIAGWRTLVGR